MKSRRLMAAPRLRTGHRTNPQPCSERGKAGGTTMSALGQKQTYALQKAMSALPPIATMKADIGKPSGLLYPPKATLGAYFVTKMPNANHHWQDGRCTTQKTAMGRFASCLINQATPDFIAIFGTD